MPIKEIRNVTLEAPMEENIIIHPHRNLNLKFMVAEWLWILYGHSELEYIAQYNKEMRKFSDDGVSMYGAYGPRWNRQRDYIIKTLTADRDSRQAVVEIWRENPEASKDVPCTLTWQFFIRNNALEMTVNMRSSDVWLGIPHDFFSFSQIGNVVAGMLGVKRGPLVMNLGSSHLYQRDEQNALQVMSTHELGHGLRSPRLHRFPPNKLDLVFMHPTPMFPNVGLDGLEGTELFYADILQSPRKQAEDRLVELTRFP